MKGFNERNPITIAVVGTVVLLAIGFLTFYSQDLPVIGGGPTYSADFSEAGGLKAGNEVMIAGVRVGSVTSVGLERAHVRVKFRVKSAWMGDQSTAAIRIQTLLGQKYLLIDPLGTSKLKTSSVIPQSRTTAPYDVTEAFSQLSTTVGQINTGQLASSFQVLTDTFSKTPSAVKSSLIGLSRLSQTISSRDNALSELLNNTKQISQTLAQNDDNIQSLIVDGNSLLDELHARSAAITALLHGTQTLSVQLSGLVNDNNATLNPALTQLDKVTTILNDNQKNLDNALRLIGPYYNLLNNAVGNGRWLDTYICGLFDAQGNPELNVGAKRNCAPQAPTGGG